MHNSSFAQYFNKYYDCDSSNDWGHTVFVQPDDSYFTFVLGQKKTNGIMAIHISKDGSQILDKHFTIQDNVNYYAGNTGQIKRMSNGNYLLPVTMQWPSTMSGDGYIGVGIILMNSIGDTIFTKSYTDTSVYWEEAQDCIVISNNAGYLLAGSTRQKGGTFASKQGLLIRTDTSGNIIWTKKYSSITSFNSVELLANGNILAGAMNSTLIWIGPGNFYYSNKPHFLLLDSSDGKILKDTIFKTPFAGGGSIFRDNNSGYYHVGNTDSVSANFPTYCAHLDENFRIKWIKYFYPEPAKRLWNFKQTSDSGYIIVGATSPPRGWAAKINKEGNVVWEHIYVYNNNDAYLTDVAEKPDGGFIFTGNAMEHNAAAWRLYDVWMLSVDSNGCLVPGCDPNGIINVPERKETEVSIYPNPTNGQLTVEAQEEGIFYVSAMDGRTVQQYAIGKGKNKLQLPALNYGMYIGRFIAVKSNKSYVLKLMYHE